MGYFMDGFKKLPKMKTGGSVRKYNEGGSLRSSLGKRELVGKPTGKFSEAGKPLFLTPDGEIVSEKSITVSSGNKFVNVPSIQKGIKRSDDEIEDMLRKNRIKPTSTHDTLNEAVEAAKTRSSGLVKYAKGRTVKRKVRK